MPDIPIPIQVVYAGLAGSLLALLVAAMTNGWSCRVFFLLALRLAIGWHFMFEGLYKINTHHGSGRPFSSEPYFKSAPGPLGPYMRKQFEDPAAEIAEKVKVRSDIKASDFAKLSNEKQADECPKAVAAELDRLATRTPAPSAKLIEAAKAKYAKWVYGVDGRDCKVKSVNGDVKLTAPQRLSHLDHLRAALLEDQERLDAKLGTGYSIEIKRAAEDRNDYIAAEADLAKDADAFIAELKKELTGGAKDDTPVAPKPGVMMDRVTMWFLTGVGACLLAGLLTRLSCIMAAGFLVATYLTHPPFPWFPLPPNTEGNPLFINKNVIECLALLVLATFPTGRWMGLDALLCRIIFGPAEPESTKA